MPVAMPPTLQEGPVHDPSPRRERRTASAGAGEDTAGQAGVIGIGLAAVLTFALAQGSWQWFATFIGVTLFAVVFAFQVRPAWRPGLRTAYMRALVAYALVAGLCAAIAVAPMLQRWEWLFPMPGTRSGCEGIGRYEVIRTRAAVAEPAGSDAAALALRAGEPAGEGRRRLPGVHDDPVAAPVRGRGGRAGGRGGVVLRPEPGREALPARFLPAGAGGHGERGGPVRRRSGAAVRHAPAPPLRVRRGSQSARGTAMSQAGSAGPISDQSTK